MTDSSEQSVFERTVLTNLRKIMDIKAHIAFHMARPNPDRAAIDQWEEVLAELTGDLTELLAEEGIPVRSTARMEAMA